MKYSKYSKADSKQWEGSPTPLVRRHPDPTESFTESEVISTIIDGRDLPTLNHLDFSKEF
jgi:hypothetical protein